MSTEPPALPSPSDLEDPDYAVAMAGVRKVYPGGQEALAGIDLTVRRGELFGFLGPNGAGKSTAIRILCGLMPPTAGEVRVLGRPVAEEPLALRRRIGVLPEETALYERLSPHETLDLVGRLHGLEPDEIVRRGEALFALLEIEESDRDRMVLDFSMGMRKKVSLACALVHGPELLFLDEPFNGIDAVTVRAIRGVLDDAVEKGLTIFFSSHVLEQVERMCSRAAIIVGGRIMALGELPELRRVSGLGEDASLEDVFVKLVGGERTGAGGLEFLA